jgi:hypothetical protein
MSQAYLNLIRNGWIYAPRMPGAFHSGLLRQGRMVRLGDETGPVTAPSVSGDIGTGTEQAVAAIRALLEA